MFTIEIAVLVVLLALWLRRPGSPVHWNTPVNRQGVPTAWVTIAAVGGFVASSCFVRLYRLPHGTWDAWAIWNSHSRYLYRDGPEWHLHIQNTFHGDYPLLLPVNVSRLWRYAGTEVPDLGGLFALLFVFSGVAIVAAILAELHRSSMSFWGTLLLLTTPNYVLPAVHQEADLPLSIYFAATIGLLALYFDNPARSTGALVLAGFMAGCAGWTKNEGLLFILAISIALLVPVLWRPLPTLRSYLVFLAGLALPFAVNLYFKIAIAPPNDLTSDRSAAEAIAKLFDTSRHTTILGDFAQGLWNLGGWTIPPLLPLLVFLLLKGVEHRLGLQPGWLTGVAALGIVLIGYYWVYVLTPMDLRWHLDSSLPRLLMHLWPSLVVLAGIAAAPELEMK
jgi:hypothetical protein